jgi:hypothetical protein
MHPIASPYFRKNGKNGLADFVFQTHRFARLDGLVEEYGLDRR